MHPDAPLITSVQNPHVKRLRKLLRNRRYREAEGVFVVEGIAQVRQAIDMGAPLERLVVAPDLLRSEGAMEAVSKQAEAGVEVITLGREAFESVFDRDHPAGLAATVGIRERTLDAVVADRGGIFVGLLDVGNPGNLGSIIRTVDAVGGGGVILVGDSTDQFHPVAVKASMGTLFSVDISRAPSIDDVIAWTMMEGVSVVTTSSKAEISFWEVDYEPPLLIMFGSETHGLPPEVIERGRVSVKAPMEGVASSLNLAVSVGVVLYEVKRRLLGNG